MTVYRLGTRGSVLATTQSGHVARALGETGVECELVVVRTEGDTNRASLASLGGTGVFAAELREALLDGRCDLAVHSLKDLPTAQPDGLVVAAVPARVDPSDVLCTARAATLADLPPGARVGTGSPRRVAQLLALRPDLDVVDLRGNVDTRLARVFGPGADLDAVVLARAGLERLGRLDTSLPTLPEGSGPTMVTITGVLGGTAFAQVLEPGHGDSWLPAPGQGALAVEVRADEDTPLTQAVRALDHLPSRREVTAERALLARLGAGCSAPVGALARTEAVDGCGTVDRPDRSVADRGVLYLSAVVGTPAGLVRRTGQAETSLTDGLAAAESLGVRVADDLLAAVR